MNSGRKMNQGVGRSRPPLIIMKNRSQRAAYSSAVINDLFNFPCASFQLCRVLRGVGAWEAGRSVQSPERGRAGPGGAQACPKAWLGPPRETAVSGLLQKQAHFLHTHLRFYCELPILPHGRCSGACLSSGGSHGGGSGAIGCRRFSGDTHNCQPHLPVHIQRPCFSYCCAHWCRGRGGRVLKRLFLLPTSQPEPQTFLRTRPPN